MTTLGYDTFGGQTEVKDPRGKVTMTSYDGRGRQVTVASPPYTTPAGPTVTASTALVRTTSTTTRAW